MWMSRAVWINYQDMGMKASLIQTGALLMDSKYMGSLGSLNKIPAEYWAPLAGETHDLSEYHCAQWAPTGVFKTKCDSAKIAVVCEAAGSSKPHTLRKYLTNVNYAGSEEERRGTSMMQNGPDGKRADGPTNMMQNGKREEAPVITKRHPGAGWEESEREGRYAPGVMC